MKIAPVTTATFQSFAQSAAAAITGVRMTARRQQPEAT